MNAEICAKLRGKLSVSGSEGESVQIPRDMQILVPHNSDHITTRQRIIDLYDDLRPSLHACLCTLGVSSDQAEDVIQETFLRLVRFRFPRNSEDNLRAWLFRVAHNLFMDVHRFQRRWSHDHDEQSRTDIRHHADPGLNAAQRLILQERRRQFENAFAQLTPKQRQCDLLRAEGFRYREIATTLGVSVQRVGELMQRSIVLLAADI
jgi:RNA polymerase sigma-70 factor (ECF subfamily)